LSKTYFLILLSPAPETLNSQNAVIMAFYNLALSPHVSNH